MNKSVSISAIFLTLLTVACDSGDNPVAPEPPILEPSTFIITLSAAPPQLEAGSNETSTITVTVKRRSDNQPPANGVEVSLSTTLGTFSVGNHLTASVVTLPLADGRAQTLLVANSPPGSASLLARLGDSLGEMIFQMVAPDAPVVTGVVPNLGMPEGGERVVVEGNHFVQPLQVSFGAVSAEVLEVPSQHRIKVVVPPAPSTVQPGSNLPVDVTVRTRLGQPTAASATLPGGYVYTADEIPAFFLSAVNPNTGFPEGGQRILIEGGGFREPVRVHFASSAAEVVSVTGQRIRVVSPPAESTVNPGERLAVDVMVTNAIDEATPTTLTLPGGFTYSNEESQLFVTDVIPRSGGPTGGERVRVFGGGFRQPLRVEFDAQPGGRAVWLSSNELTVLVPAPATAVEAGQTLRVGVTVINQVDTGGAERVTLANAYTYVGPNVRPLFVTEVAPNRGGARGGERVRIRGGGFLAPVRVEFATQPAADAQVLSASEISAVVPAPAMPVGTGEELTVDLTVVNRDGATSEPLANAYTYTGERAPEIFSVVPNFGPNEGGTTITVTGMHFEDPVDLLMGGFTVSGVSFVSPAELTAVTPRASQANRNMAVDVVVRNRRTGLEATLAGGFSYVEELLLTSLSPASGPYTGGTEVTLRGQGFIDPVAVVLAGVSQLDEVVDDATTVRFATAGVAVPTCPAGGEARQTGLTVTNLLSGNSGMADLTFTYTVPLPRVRGVSPSSGPQVGGDTVSLSGEGFEEPVRVTFAAGEEEFAATVLSVTQTEVEVTLPRVPDSVFPEEACTVGGSPGMRFTDAVVDVNITNLPTSCTDVFVGSFTYHPTNSGCRLSG